jgi:hypothetical protein
MKYTKIRATVLIAITLATSNIYAQAPTASPAPVVQIVQTVWVVDNKNTLFFREGISPQNVLGTNWIEVPGYRIILVAAGSYGHVWAITTDLKLVFREGITPSCPTGTGWKVIEERTGLIDVSIGGPDDSIVWGRDCNNKVYQRPDVIAGVPQTVGPFFKMIPKIDARSIAISPEGDIWHLGYRWQPFQYLYIRIYHSNNQITSSNSPFPSWSLILTENIDCQKIVISDQGIWVLITRKYCQLLFHNFTQDKKSLQTNPMIITDPLFSDIATNKGGDLWGIKRDGTVVARQGDTWVVAGDLGPCVRIAVGSLPYAAKPAVEKPTVEEPAVVEPASAQKQALQKSPVKEPLVKKSPVKKSSVKKQSVGKK